MGQYFENDDNLRSELRTIIYKINNNTLSFTSDLGVFSKDKVDYGSNLLINTYLENGRKEVSLLDVGCGYGIIGITLTKLMNTKTTLIDVNKRAVHLAKMNSKSNKIKTDAFISNIYENVKSKYDVIITNPPIRAGKSVVLKILLEAKEHLNENGELWFVMRKDQGALSIKKVLEEYYQITILEKSKGFLIFLAKTY